MTCRSKAASIQAKIWRGYAKVGEKLGTEYQFYRPSRSVQKLEDGGSALLEDGGQLLLESGFTFPGKPLFIRSVSLNAEDMNYRRPNKYGKATWYAVMDGHGLKVGDYFIGQTPDGRILLEDGGAMLLEDGEDMLLETVPGATFFIAAMQLMLPILVVECNRVISIYRPQTQSGVGQQGYGGTTSDNEVLLVSGVPCSILQGTKGEKSEAGLPGDTRSPWWAILMPGSVGKLLPDDIITDDLGQRYIISSQESSDMGYRITAMMALA